LRRVERELAAATALIGVATADLYPRFFITGTAGLESDRLQTLANWDSRFWSVGPSITWPVFAAGRIRANIEVQDARQAQAFDRYAQAVLLAFEEAENALVTYSKERERSAALAEAVTANRRAVELSTELYSRGLVDFLDVLDAQRALFLADDELVQSQGAVATALVALYKALGGGWDDEEIEKLREEAGTAAARGDPPS
jgi:outer membrane protein TolC